MFSQAVLIPCTSLYMIDFPNSCCWLNDSQVICQASFGFPWKPSENHCDCDFAGSWTPHWYGNSSPDCRPWRLNSFGLDLPALSIAGGLDPFCSEPAEPRLLYCLCILIRPQWDHGDPVKPLIPTCSYLSNKGTTAAKVTNLNRLHLYQTNIFFFLN